MPSIPLERGKINNYLSGFPFTIVFTCKVDILNSMAKERLSLLQKQILDIFQEEYRRLNNKGVLGFTRMQIAHRLHSKTGKVYWIQRINMDNIDREAFTGVMKGKFYVADAEHRLKSGEIDEKTKDKVVGIIDASFSPDAKNLMARWKERKELHRDYDKKQVSLTRSLKSLVDKEYFCIRESSYYITEKGLNVKLAKYN